MITFNSKETYLAYRSSWKDTYNKLSDTIRNYKHTWKHRHLKKEATVLLSELKEAKKEAQRQYLIAKTARNNLTLIGAV